MLKHYSCLFVFFAFRSVKQIDTPFQFLTGGAPRSTTLLKYSGARPSDPAEALSGACTVLLAVPSQTLRANLEVWKTHVGADATLVLAAGTPGFNFRSGEVWALHVAWSVNHTTYAERPPSGAASCR